MRLFLSLCAAVAWSVGCCLPTLSPEELAELELQRAQREQAREADRAAAEEARWKDVPAEERQFCDILTEYSQMYLATDNDLKRSALRNARAKALKAAVAKGRIERWLGTIKTLTTTSQGNAVIEMTLPCDDFGIGTWNNELSDIFDHTLVPMNSSAFQNLAELEVGNTMWFNGRLVSDRESLDGFSEASMTERGSMTGGFFLIHLDGR